MKALVRDEYGTSEVLRIDDIPVPTIKPTEVLIRVKAAAIDAGVVHLMTGTPLLVRYVGLGVKRPKNHTLGMDVAGVIEKVGDKVTTFSVGDEVFGAGIGTFAEFAVASPKKIVLKPADVPWDEAAATPVSGCTALQAIRAGGALGLNSRVLVLGASGGVGHFAVQLAKAAGAHVTGVSSGVKRDFVLSLGADEALDYRTTDVTDGTSAFDLIIDTGGSRPLAQMRRALTPSGRHIIVGGEGAGDPFLGGLERQLGASLRSLFSKQKQAGLVSLVTAKDLAELASLLEKGTIHPRINLSFSLSRGAYAIEQYEKHQATGKIVISLT